MHGSSNTEGILLDPVEETQFGRHPERLKQILAKKKTFSFLLVTSFFAEWIEIY